MLWMSSYLGIKFFVDVNVTRDMHWKITDSVLNHAWGRNIDEQIDKQITFVNNWKREWDRTKGSGKGSGVIKWSQWTRK